MWCFPRASWGSSSGQRLLCILGVHLRMSSWLWLGSAFGVVAFVCFLVFSLPPLPIRGVWGLSSIVFSIELTVQSDGCLIWGLGWRAGLVAGLWVGQAYGVSHRPGFGLLESVPISLSTQPPFMTQALNGRQRVGNQPLAHMHQWVILYTTFWKPRKHIHLALILRLHLAHGILSHH